MKKPGKKRGKLTAIYGSMFSGKTLHLIEIYGDGQETVVFKPSLDDRYTNRPAVVSNNHTEIPSVMVSHQHPDEILPLVEGFRRVFIDEVNLFSPRLVATVQSLLAAGKEVYAAGLTLDSERNVWGPMTELIALADVKVPVFARCDGDNGACPNPATLTYCKVAKTTQVAVGGVQAYGACCEKHYGILHQKSR